MVDEAGQGLVEVELAADVAGHPAQRVEPVDLLGGLLEEPGAVHGDGELAGDAVEERDVELGQAQRVCRTHDEDAPALRREGDRQGDLDGRSRVDRLPARRPFARQDRVFVAHGLADGPVRDVAARSGGSARCRASPGPRTGHRGARRRRRSRTGSDSRMSATAEPSIRSMSRPPEVRAASSARTRRSSRWRVRSVARSALTNGVTVPPWRPSPPRPAGRAWSERIGALDEREGRPAAASAAAGRAPAAVGVDAGRLGGGQEPLEVAHPIAPIAARIDPVVAESALVAPGADRVRMDAQDPGGLRHGQGRVAGARREACGHLGPCWRKCEVDGPDTREPHTSCQ